jgi:hypothetical protein
MIAYHGNLTDLVPESYIGGKRNPPRPRIFFDWFIERTTKPILRIANK